MRAIDDFEVLSRSPQESRFWNPGDPRPADIEATPEAKVDFWNLPKNLFRSFHPLFYQGARIPHIKPAGNLLWPQFEMSHGFLFFTEFEGWDPWWPSVFHPEFSNVDIYYVAKDFMAADGCSLVTEWTPSRELEVSPHAERLDGSEPLSFVGIAGEDSLIFHVKWLGWVKLTVIDPPRKKRFSLRWFKHEVHPKMPRHFHLSNATEEDGRRCAQQYIPVPAE